MNKKQIISAIVSVVMMLGQIPANASEIQQSTYAVGEKNVIEEEDFSKGLASWETKSGYGFYIANKKLVFDNMREKVISSIITSNEFVIENGEIEFLLNIKKGDYFGVIFRMSDDKSMYALRFYPERNKAILLKQVKGGEYIDIKSAYIPLEYEENYKVGITLIGKNIKVTVNSNKIIDIEDSSLNNGKIGFEGYNSSAFVDDLSIFRYSGIEYDIKDINVKEAAKVYVSPSGNDNLADGTEDNPYRTIIAAKKAANKLKRSDRPVDVIFKEGIYNITETIAFTSSDSGTKEAPVRYMAKDGEKVIFSGAIDLDISKFEPVNKEVKNRLYDDVKDKVIELNLKEQGIPEELINFTALGDSKAIGQNLKPPVITLNNSRQSIARWPNAGYKSVISCEAGDNISQNGTKENGGTIYYTDSNPTRWQNAKDMYVEGFLGVFWHGEWAKIDNIDLNNNAINLKYYSRYGIKENHRWSVINLLEEIDIPGEWYIDSEDMMLYYYPPHELSKKDKLQMAILKSNMIDFNGAENITLEGIEFTMTADDPTVSEVNSTGGNGINIGGGAKNITIKNCTLSHIGMNGININADNITVDGCLIYDVGFNGINVGTSGDRKTLTSGNVVIKNCDISDVNRDTNRNSYGGIILEANSVGVEISNNIIHNCKNNAIRYAGNGHQILYNEIYNSVTQCADAGAVYSGRSFAEYGTAVNYNFFHDIGQKSNDSNYPASSIFWDDFQSGGEFSHNISVVNNYSKTSSVKIGGGIDNIVKGNTMVAAQYDIIAEDRSTSQNINWQEYANKTLKLSTVPYTSSEWVAKYPEISRILPNTESNGNILKLKNTITDNFSVDCTETRVAKTVQEASTYGNNVMIPKDDSVFVNPEKLDYRITKAAKEKYNISDEVLDEDFDINKIGIINGYKFDVKNLEFLTTYPENGAENIETKDVMLAWQQAPVADDYRYIIATDPGLENVVKEGVTIERAVKIEGLNNSTVYYWTVYARNTSRQFGVEAEALNGIMSFATSESDTLDMKMLNATINDAYAVIDNISEGNEVGQYKPGTIKIIESEIEKAEEKAALEKGLQAEIDMVNYDLRMFLSNIESMVNSGYTTLDVTSDSEWYANSKETIVTPMNKGVKAVFGAGTEVSYMKTLSNYNVMCFRTKIDVLKDTWVAFGLRALDAEKPLYGQDAYYILVKEDIFELQKHGVIYATAPNNGKMKAGEWYEVQFGSITTQNGINMLFKLNGEVIFDYLDKNEPQNKPGMFAMFASKGNTIEVQASENVPDGLYVMSDKILHEVSIRDENEKTFNVLSEGYTEIGDWKDNDVLLGDNGAKVRTAATGNISAKWIMESGTKGNGKLYKVSYYHIPQADGDKNVKVKISGYAGEYETVIDLSKGKEGYVDIGTFTFIAADYIGRLSIEFIGSGEGSVNMSNVRYELVDEGEYSNMLK